MHGTWKKALAPALAVAVSALSLSATALPASASGTKPTYIIAYEGPLSGGNAQLGLNMEYSVELAINQANATGQPALHPQVQGRRRPGIGHRFADRRSGTGQQLSGRGRGRPGVLGRHRGRRADVLVSQPGHRQPVGDGTDSGPKGMAQLLPGRRR